MKKIAAFTAFILLSIFATAQNGGSKYQSAITPVPCAITHPRVASTSFISPDGDTARINLLKAKVLAGTATAKEMRELRNLQSGNKNYAEQSKSRFGIVLYPVPQEVSLKEHFGKSGFGNRVCLEEKFGLQYESYQIFNLTLSWRDVQFDTRLLFTWRNKPSCRMYSGLGLDFTGTIMAKDDWGLDGYREIIPIGMELFPSERLPNLGLIGEVALRELSGMHINAGIVYYLR